MAITLDQDSFVQVAADGTGKKIDNAALKRDDGSTVYRQRTVIASDENPRIQAEVRGESGQAYLMIDSRAFDELIEAVQEMNELMRFRMGLDD